MPSGSSKKVLNELKNWLRPSKLEIFSEEETMDSKVKGVLLGVAGIILWFMPLIAWKQEFMGESMNMYQAGSNIGGIAYLLLLSSLAYAVLSWLNQHQLRIIAGGVASGICVLFLIHAGSSTAWGLIALSIVSAASIWFAVIDHKKNKRHQISTGTNATT